MTYKTGQTNMKIFSSAMEMEISIVSVHLKPNKFKFHGTTLSVVVVITKYHWGDGYTRTKFGEQKYTSRMENGRSLRAIV